MRSLRWVGLSALVAAVVACGSTTTVVHNAGETTPPPTGATPTTGAPTATAAPTTTATTAEPTTPTATGGGLTLEAYNKLMVGMTEAEVTAITGPCETTSETNIAGISSKTLECKGSEPFSSAILIFTDGKLDSKSQIGLGGSSGQAQGSMTLAKFNQLRIGQTAAEVEAITGPCEKSSEANIAGESSFALTCYASDGIGNALLTFSNDKLESKSQFGLQ